MTVNMNTGKPPKEYSDKQWQNDFERIKQNTSQSLSNYMPVELDDDSEQNTYNEFINDVLNNIRAGATDYCFYIYQIAELLRYEHNRLKTKYDKGNECFLVWLL